MDKYPVEMTLSGGGINWSWFLVIQRTSKLRCRIINHFRLHNWRDPNHPKTNGSYRIIEDEKPIGKDGWKSRNAMAVRMWTNEVTQEGVRMKVTNPGYVFGYDGKTDQPEMQG